MMRISQKKTDKYLWWVWKFKGKVSEPYPKLLTCSDPRCGKELPCFNGEQVPCQWMGEERKLTNPKWEIWLDRFSIKVQKWFLNKGISIHNPIRNECCIDFSCCIDDVSDEHKPLLKAIADAAKKDNPIIKWFKLSKNKSN